MDMIFKVVLAFFITVSIAITGTSIVSVGQDVVIANNYFDDVCTVITESNYNGNVIAACIDEAADNGYELTVDVIGSSSPGMMRYAEAEMEYTYSIPLFGVSDTKEKHKII